MSSGYIRFDILSSSSTPSPSTTSQLILTFIIIFKLISADNEYSSLQLRLNQLDNRKNTLENTSESYQNELTNLINGIYSLNDGASTSNVEYNGEEEVSEAQVGPEGFQPSPTSSEDYETSFKAGEKVPRSHDLWNGETLNSSISTIINIAVPFSGFEVSQKFPQSELTSPSLSTLPKKYQVQHLDNNPNDPANKPVTSNPNSSEDSSFNFNLNQTDIDYDYLYQTIVNNNYNDSNGEGFVDDVDDAKEEFNEISTSLSTREVEDKLQVTILGLFEFSQGSQSRPEGFSELQAAKLAIDRINRMDILPRFQLHLVYNDTKCDPGVGVDRFFHALYTSKEPRLMPFLLGTSCSEVTETLAKIVPYWNIVQVSFGSMVPSLSDQSEYPLFLRTVAPDSSHNPARIALIKYFGWDTVTTLSQSGDMYSLAVNDLVTELEQANITCTATITFGENDYIEQLKALKELDTRIIVSSFSPKLLPRLFCEAWKLGMYGGDYAWILPEETIDLLEMKKQLWDKVNDCTFYQLTEALNGLIIVKSYGSLLTDELSSSGLTTLEFLSEIERKMEAGVDVEISKYSGQTFDAIWAIALGLSNAEIILNHHNTSISEYTHFRKDIAHTLLTEMKNLKFHGISGPVSFDGADRVGITAFYQINGRSMKRIAIYTPENEHLTMDCPGCSKFHWPGGHPPVARRVFRIRMETINSVAFLAIACVAGAGMTLALSFLAFNLHFHRHKSIKLSSPRLNNMAAVGCVLVYGAVILLGLDDATLPNNYFPMICTARVYLLSAGFSLAFGSMFTKTYRVHRIFTRSHSSVIKKKLLQDTQLISLICILLLIDGLVVTLWVTLDPMERYLRNLTLEINPQDRGVVYQPQVEVCRSQHTNGWLASLYAYKGLLLVVGVYMAWETRHVKIPELNDLRYIGTSVYSVVITSGIVVVLANLMSDRVTLAFITITIFILASTTSTLALLFLPQLANILGGERADPVVQSLGLKIECNTRRFVTDDKRELQYRVEVQNRVYRREMAQLESEIARLEKQLGQEPIDPSNASSSTSIPQRNPSIGGGLPLLLLSVLPPVIPRASWPSADPSGIRRGTVAFSSQPDLEPSEEVRNLADMYKLQWRRETEGPNRLGVFQRLFSLFGSRPNSRKTSTASFTGVASALKVHMGYIANLVPGSSTCQMNVPHHPSGRAFHPRCGSGPIINVTSDEDRRLSLGLQRKESSEPRVNFTLPSKVSTSQSSSRERIKGSPRFPHRIIPTNSLGTISNCLNVTKPHRWKSMEVTGSIRSRMATGNDDVWATHEVGIPLSELANSSRGRMNPRIDHQTIEIDNISHGFNDDDDDNSSAVDLKRLLLTGNPNLLSLKSSSDDGPSMSDLELKVIKSSTISSLSSSLNKLSNSTTIKCEAKSKLMTLTSIKNNVEINADCQSNWNEQSSNVNLNEIEQEEEEEGEEKEEDDIYKCSSNCDDIKQISDDNN